jgi:Protein of unknown function (DUF3224)
VGALPLLSAFGTVAIINIDGQTRPEVPVEPLELRFEIKSWDENTFHKLADEHKLTQAKVPLSVSHPRLEAEAGMTTLMHYDAGGASTYVGLLWVDGRLDGRQGTFTMLGTGTFDGTTARVDFSVVPGSGTGELTGIQGTASSVSTHADFPHMPVSLDYRLD